jgi:hypothetical protein
MGAMPTLAVGMLANSSAILMPTASVGMAPELISSGLTEHYPRPLFHSPRKGRKQMQRDDVEKIRRLKTIGCWKLILFLPALFLFSLLLDYLKTPFDLLYRQICLLGFVVVYFIPLLAMIIWIKLKERQRGP